MNSLGQKAWKIYEGVLLVWARSIWLQVQSGGGTSVGAQPSLSFNSPRSNRNKQGLQCNYLISFPVEPQCDS